MRARPASTALSLIAITILGLAGCAGGNGPADTRASAATSAPAADARQAFAAATAKLIEQSVRFDMAMADQFAVIGHLDPKGLKAKVSGFLPIGGERNKIDVVVMGEDVWLRIGGLAGLEKWMHTSADKIKGTSIDLADPANPAGIMDMINAVNNVQHDGADGFKGTVDMTKSRNANPEASAVLGYKLKAVPYTASLHADGNLKTFVIDMSSFATGMTMTATYSEYGTPFEVQAPPSDEVIEMPARLLAAVTS